MDTQKMSEYKKATYEIYGSFYVGQTEVAINVKSIQEVVNLPEAIISMPLAPSYLMGIFNLRGKIVPIINLKALLNFDEAEILPSQKVGIIEHQGAKVGLLFDSTSEILRLKSEDVDDFNYSVEKSSNQVVRGAIKLDSGKRLVQIIDPFALLRVENIPQIIEQQRLSGEGIAKSHYQHENRKKCISFCVNGMKMGFEISGISEIIKVPDIQVSAFQDDLCVGMVNLRGHTVPVIDFYCLLNSSPSDISNIKEKRIIVLKIEKEYFGLLVDSVESINTFLSNDIMPIPLLSGNRVKMFQGCVVLDGIGEVILLDHKEVLSNDEILTITKGHSKLYQSDEKEKAEAKKNVGRQVYISFMLDRLFGVSIKEVREIIEYSENIVTTPGAPPMVKGVLNLRGKLVTIVDTRSLFKIEQSKTLDPKKSKILVFDNEEEKFGLIVDSVESIVVIDLEKKLKVPSILSQQVNDGLENDIKEIVTLPEADGKEGTLVVLTIAPLISRIKNSVSA